MVHDYTETILYDVMGQHRFYILVWIYLHAHLLSCAVAKETKQCTFIMKETLEECGNRVAELATFRDMKKNKIDSLNSTTQNNSNKDCGDDGKCRRIYKISRIRRQSFSTKTLVQISNLLYRCCGNCTSYYLMDIHTPLAQLDLSFLRNSDIIYPVPARSQLLQELHGFNYIPVFNIPSAYYFTRKISEREMTMNMIYGCLSMWPLLAICLLMAVIAGFIAWIIETWGNPEEFPRSFHIGWLDGFWWSFISMTTVGYGDKSPKSFLARIFAVFWILTGITICSIYIAALAGEIIKHLQNDNIELAGMRVGTLQNQLHDSSMVSQHGGSVHAIEFNDTVIGIIELIKQLERKEIDGYLISRPIYYYFARSIEEKEKYKIPHAIIRHVPLHRTEKFFRNEILVTGMLVKHDDDYNYFRKYFESNWLQIQGCYSINLNYKDKKFESHNYSPVAGMFYPFLIATVIIIGCILLFGLAYELIRRNKNRNVREDEIDKMSLQGLSN